MDDDALPPGIAALLDGDVAVRAPAYEGLDLADAEALAERDGADGVRVVDVDGEPVVLTMDHRPGRVNLFTAAGVVVRAARF